MILRNPEFWLHNSLQEPCNFNGESLRERVGRDCQRRRRRCSPQRPSDSGLSQAVLPVGQLVPLAQRSLHARRGGTPPLTTFLATEACGAGQPSPSSVHLKRGAPSSPPHTCPAERTPWTSSSTSSVSLHQHPEGNGTVNCPADSEDSSWLAGCTCTWLGKCSCTCYHQDKCSS